MMQTTFPRPISDHEIAVVERALSVAALQPLTSDMSAHVRSLTVVSQCDCGCASVDFSVTPTENDHYIIADAKGNAPDGDAVGVLIWAVDNAISEIEVFNYTNKPALLPVVESIQSCMQSVKSVT